MRARFSLAVLAMILSVSSLRESAAQTIPQSGAANQFLGQIKTSSVGTGYSINSQNSLALSQGRGGAIFQNLGRNPSEFLSSQSSSSYRPAASNGSIYGSGGAQPLSKPFAGASNGPTVSPYLALFGNGVTNSDLNYNTIVRPMLQQQEMNQQLQRQQQDLGRRFQALSGQPAFDPRGSQSQLPTGHTTVYRAYSHYYPGMNQQRPRR